MGYEPTVASSSLARGSMKKVVPLRQQITRAVLNNPRYDHSFLVSGCFCTYYDADELTECDKCRIRFYCYTNFRVAPVAELEQ